MLPHILLYLRFRKTIDADLEPYGEGKGGILTFIKVCTRQKVFRNLFYYRLGEYRSVFIKWLMPEDKSLHITCPSIGEGCHLEHSYSTYLNADSIGATSIVCTSLRSATARTDAPPLATT